MLIIEIFSFFISSVNAIALVFFSEQFCNRVYLVLFRNYYGYYTELRPNKASDHKFKVKKKHVPILNITLSPFCKTICNEFLSARCGVEVSVRTGEQPQSSSSEVIHVTKWGTVHHLYFNFTSVRSLGLKPGNTVLFNTGNTPSLLVLNFCKGFFSDNIFFAPFGVL